ncbi:protein timeless-like [Babylonia areolata]|uniref:protein timeless-like n=1 Tax=Babylonia areolata TaxID=304850 RepID=UPI003FD4EA3C
MEWNLMEPGGSGASGLGCFVEDIYVPADDCEDVLDEIIESLTREDPKLRNGRRKLSCDKIVEKDLVPLIMCCTDEDIIGRCLRLLANLTQPLEVFLQLGVSLGQQCQREINSLVNGAKARCTDLDFFKSLQNRMEMALVRNGEEKVQLADSELLNHALLLLRNLLHTSPDDQLSSETSITLQSMLSSFFLSEMDKLLLRMLNHPQKSDWVVSIVQLLSLVFKDHAGVLLEEDEEDDHYNSDCKSECDSVSDILEFIPSQTSKLLSHNFDKQLQIGEVFMTGSQVTSPADIKASKTDGNFDRAGSVDSCHAPPYREEKDMQTDEEDPPEDDDDNNSSSNDKRDDAHKPSSPQQGRITSLEEDMSVSDDYEKKGSGKSTPEDVFTMKQKQTDDENDAIFNNRHDSSTDDDDSGRPDSREDGEKSGGERSPTETQGKDSGVECALMMWEHMQQGLEEKERGIMSELSSGSCLMDGDIIVSYLRKFATDIVCSGLSNLVKSLMKALMSSYEGVLDDSFFMWTVGFFLSFARHSHVEFDQYRDLLNLDVFGFLVYQGYRNCETLACQKKKQENCSLIKYRLHLVVCTLNQLFQVLLSHAKEAELDGEYIRNVQKCLAQMADLQRLFVLLIRSHQAPCQEVVYLRDLIHTNHTYLLLLEEWVSQGYLPQHFSMLSHVKQFATAEVMEKYGSLLEQYTSNNETLNVAILTMMYHIAGDCNRGDVLLQLPILKKFSDIWGDITCSKYMEFNDLIEFVLESFMSMAFKDPVKCAQKLFDMTSPGQDMALGSPDTAPDIGGLTEEEQDLLFTWTTDLQGSVNMVDDLVRRLHNQGSSATRQHVMLHLLCNGWLEEKQLEALSEEIKELQEKTSTVKKNPLLTELSGLEQDQLIPFLVEKIKGAGNQEQLKWLQDQLLEAAYVKIGIRDSKYRVHVEEPLARFYALQDKSIPLVAVNEEEERVVRDPCFTALLEGLGLFPADAGPSCVFCRIPHFLTPAQLIIKAQQLGDIDLSMVKFDLTQVQDDLSFTEFTPLFKDPDSADNQKTTPNSDIRPTVETQNHQWLRFVCHLNRSKEATPTQT